MAGQIKTLSIIILLTFICLSFSCELQNKEDSSSYLGCWGSIEKKSGYSGTVVQVRLENSNGNIPTGARVLVLTPANELKWLVFDSDLNLYQGNINGSISGNYTIRAESVLGTRELSIPYTAISSSPAITAITDATGTTTGQGDNLDSTTAISFSWQEASGANVYKCTVYDGAYTHCVFSTTDEYYTLSANTLEADTSYSIIVEAQYISGDPFFIEEDFYAFNYSESTEYYFSTL